MFKRVKKFFTLRHYNVSITLNGTYLSTATNLNAAMLRSSTEKLIANFDSGMYNAGEELTITIKRVD